MIALARKNPVVSPIKNDLGTESNAQVCPKCGRGMKKRVARQGNNAGKQFGGCRAFPKCNGIRPLDGSASDQHR